MNHYAIIMAGGPGTRLWPLSRAGRPKQVLKLVGDRSLLSLSFDRLSALMPAERIIVIGAERHRAACRADLPQLPAENYIGEPIPRDTAAAIALASAVIHRRDAAAVLGVFTADHVIEPVDRFRAAVERGYAAAAEHPAALVTFGIKPASPHTGYGYIHRGEKMAEGLHRVQRFTEKPDPTTAKNFVAGGEHLWNSGMFVWRAETILGELKQHLRATHDAAIALAADPSLAGELYPALPRISIDFAVMEKAREVLVVDMDVRWADVGSWPALKHVWSPDDCGNVLAAARAVGLDARDCTIVSEDDHLIAAVGVRDLVIVHSADATLVCRTGDAERLKELLKQIESRFGGEFA